MKKIYKVGLFEIGDEFLYKGKITKLGEIAVFKSVLGVTEISTGTFISSISKKDIKDSFVYYPTKNNDVTRDFVVLYEDLNKNNIMNLEDINDYFDNGSKRFREIVEDKKERGYIYELSRGSKK